MRFKAGYDHQGQSFSFESSILAVGCSYSIYLILPEHRFQVYEIADITA